MDTNKLPEEPALVAKPPGHAPFHFELTAEIAQALLAGYCVTFEVNGEHRVWLTVQKDVTLLEERVGE